jgi:hypothetical protein
MELESLHELCALTQAKLADDDSAGDIVSRGTAELAVPSSADSGGSETVEALRKQLESTRRQRQVTEEALLMARKRSAAKHAELEVVQVTSQTLRSLKMEPADAGASSSASVR